MNTVIEKVKTGAMKIKDLAIANPIVVGLLLVILVLFILVVKKEDFDGMVEGVKELAEFPAIFAEKLVSADIKGIVYENYFKPATEAVMPMEVVGNQLELPSHEATVKVDIGNGMAVDAKVQVPAQTISVPTQDAQVIPEAKMTDTTVSAQTIQLPAQTGMMPAAVEGSDKSVLVPVEIPAQVVSIPEQQAVVPVIEPFRMM